MTRNWVAALVLFPAFVLASEECVAQLGGKCRAECPPTEKSEQGAFIDCAEKDKCCVPTAAAKKEPIASAPTVVIDQMAFSPPVLTIKAGAEVVWRNDESSIHAVTADDGSFRSPPLEKGQLFRKAFARPGTYSYTCEMHPFMSGKIVVE